MIFEDPVFGNPEIDPKSFVSSRTAIIGRVIIEKNVIVAPGTSIRADEPSPFPFRICKGSNIQDGVIIHGLHGKYVEIDGEKYSVYIGSHCSIAHGARVHGPIEIGKKTFIGFGAVVHNCRIGRNCYIGHNAVVEGVTIAPGRYVPNLTNVDCQEIADKLPVVPEAKVSFNKEVVDVNKFLVEHYKERRKAREREQGSKSK